MKIRAAVSWEPGTAYQMEEVELAPPKAREVLVEVVATGVCHTDTAAQAGHMGVPFPIVLGHEGSGIVKEVGEAVTSVKPGDHVVIACCKCDHCDPCLSGHPGECEDIPRLNFGGAMEDNTCRISKSGQDIGTFFGQSTFANYAITNEKNLVKIDAGLDLKLYGPLGCGITTGASTVLEMIRPKFASTIAVYGCGAVGLSALMAAKIANCEKIIAVDINDERLALAKELGATHTINSKSIDIVEAIHEVTDGRGTTYGLDATGNANVAVKALSALEKSGELVLIGAGYQPIPVDFNSEFLFGTKTLRGMIAGKVPSQYIVPKLIAYHQKGLFPFDKLVKFYSFDDINQAFADTNSGKAIKPILLMK